VSAKRSCVWRLFNDSSARSTALASTPPCVCGGEPARSRGLSVSRCHKIISPPRKYRPFTPAGMQQTHKRSTMPRKCPRLRIEVRPTALALGFWLRLTFNARAAVVMTRTYAKCQGQRQSENGQTGERTDGVDRNRVSAI